MFSLRRAATRIVAQPPRQLSTPRSCPARVTLFQTATPKLYRSFHLSRAWFAEPPTTERDAEREDNVVEKSVNESDAVSEASGSTADPIGRDSSSFTDRAKDYASNAAEGVRSAAQSAAQSGSDALGRASRFHGSRLEPQPNRILYVGNLFFEVTAPQLEAEFSQFGKILNCRVVTDSRGLSKGFAYVEYDSPEAAAQAIAERNQRQFQGRRMAVQFHAPRTSEREQRGSKPSNPPSKTLFIGNMSYQMSDRDLNDLFREIRDVLDVRVAIDRRTGQPRGFAHADFIDVTAATRAKEYLEQKLIYNRQLRVDYSTSSAITKQNNQAQE